MVSVFSLSLFLLKGDHLISHHYWHWRCADVSLLPAEVHVAECDTDPTKRACRRVFVFRCACVHLCGSACSVACSSVCMSLCTRATVCVMSLTASLCVHNTELTAGAAEISSFSSFRSLWKQSNRTTAAGTAANGYLSPWVIVSPWIPPTA